MNKIATIQLNSSNIVDKNLAKVEMLVNKSKQAGAKLVLLPENCTFMGQTQIDTKSIAEELADFSIGTIQSKLSKIAKKNKIWILAGGVATIQEGKIYQTLLVFNDIGVLVEFYNKIHLFDVDLPNIEESYRESDLFNSDENCKLKVVDTPVGKIGLSICYDLRFPEQFRKLVNMGAEIFIMPAAFTYATGKAHWEVLSRARAIENLCYMVCSGQTGKHISNRRTWGHSMIINYWGEIISSLNEEEGFLIEDIDLNKLREIRVKFPVLQHIK